MRSNHAGFLIDIDQESVGARDLLEESNSNGSSNPAALSVRKSRQSLFARIRLKQAASPIYAPSWESRSIGHEFPTHCAAARALAQRMSCLRDVRGCLSAVRTGLEPNPPYGLLVE